MAKRSKPLRRPTAGQQGGCRGGSAPPPKIITFSAGQQISGGQQGVQGGQRPPAQNYTTTTVTVTVTIIITIIFYNLNKAGWSPGRHIYRILNSELIKTPKNSEKSDFSE